MQHVSEIQSLSPDLLRVALPGELLAIALLVATVSISGCSSSDNDSSPGSVNVGADDTSDPGETSGPADDGSVTQGADSFTQFGSVSIIRSSSAPETIVAYGGFSMPEGATYDLVASDFPTDELPIDVCAVQIEEEDLDDDDDLENIQGFSNISAGETITFSSEAGTWLTLSRIQETGYTIYLPEVDPLSSIASGLNMVPNGLVVDIPGDVFPAFPDVSIPDVAPLSGVATDGETVTPDTLFQWDAGGDDPSVYIRIDLETLDEETSVACLAADDGEFSIPDELQAELGSNFSATASLARIGQITRQSGDAILIVNNAYLSEPAE